MATSKYTNYQALTDALAMVKGEAVETDTDVLIAKLEHMVEQAGKTRKRTAKSGPSKSQRELTALTDAVVAKMDAETEYGTPEVRDLIDRDMVLKFAVPFNSNGIISSQKVTAIMTNAAKRGLIVKCNGDKGAARYKLA